MILIVTRTMPQSSEKSHREKTCAKCHRHRDRLAKKDERKEKQKRLSPQRYDENGPIPREKDEKSVWPRLVCGYAFFHPPRNPFIYSPRRCVSDEQRAQMQANHVCCKCCDLDNLDKETYVFARDRDRDAQHTLNSDSE